MSSSCKRCCNTYHLPFFLSVKSSCGTSPHPLCMFLPLRFQGLVYNLLLLHQSKDPVLTWPHLPQFWSPVVLKGSILKKYNTYIPEDEISIALLWNYIKCITIPSSAISLISTAAKYMQLFQVKHKPQCCHCCRKLKNWWSVDFWTLYLVMCMHAYKLQVGDSKYFTTKIWRALCKLAPRVCMRLKTLGIRPTKSAISYRWSSTIFHPQNS